MESLELTRVFADLRSGAMSVVDHRLAVQAGRLARWILNDEPFEDENPEHPQALTNRDRRIKASDRIRELAQTKPELFTEQRLRHLHAAAFDCCAAVRLSVVATLAVLRRTESLPVLEEVAGEERESPRVAQAAKDATRLLRGEIALAESTELAGLAPLVCRRDA